MSKPGKVLKGLCKKLGVRLTVKRGQKRVYKSVAVLKAQCKKKVKKKKVKKKKKKVKRKRKVKKKKVKRRKAKFGASRANFDEPLYDYGENHLMSSLHNQRRKTQEAIQSIYNFQVPLNYFDSGYNPFDVHEFSKNLMNDSINDPRKMIDLIMSSFEMEDDLGSKSIHYLLHNEFFKTDTGDFSLDADLLSNYMLGDYHKRVPFKREDSGQPLLGKARRVCINNTEVIDENEVRIRAKRYLWHDNLYDINWDNPDGGYPILTGVKTEKCLRREAVIEFIRENERFPNISDDDRNWIINRTQQKFDNRQPIPVDQILQEINDRELRAINFFLKQHQSIYTDQVIANNNELQRRWGEYIYINRGDSSILLNTFLVRVLEEYVRLCHTLRVYSINLGITKVTKNDTGVSTYHFSSHQLRICSCPNFYFSRFNQHIPWHNRALRDNSVIYPIAQRYTMTPRMSARRVCKHLRNVPSTRGGGEVFTVNNDIEILLPGNEQLNLTSTQQMLFNIIKLMQPERLTERGINLNDLGYFGSINVIERQLHELLPINNPGVQPGGEIINPEDLVRRNSKRGFVDGRQNSCYLCLSEKPFLLKNCPENCIESLICLDCIKNYPVNWSNRGIRGNSRIKCGFCREMLTNRQTTDFERMRTDPNFNEEQFNELSYDLYPEMRNLFDELPRGGFFGKKKKKVGIPTSLKKVCKRLKIRLTTKRKGKRVYKSVKVLKELCKKALKKKKKVLRKSKAGKKKKKVLRKSKAGKKKKKVVRKRKKVVKKKRKKVVKKKRKKVVRKRKKVVKRKRKFGRNPTPSITMSPVKYNPSKLYRHHVPSQKSMNMISGEPKDNQQYKSYKGSSSTYGF